MKVPLVKDTFCADVQGWFRDADPKGRRAMTYEVMVTHLRRACAGQPRRVKKQARKMVRLVRGMTDPFSARRGGKNVKVLMLRTKWVLPPRNAAKE